MADAIIATASAADAPPPPLLRPWHAALRELIVPRYDYRSTVRSSAGADDRSQRTRVKWVSCLASDVIADHDLRDAGEGLELLALLSACDQVTWRREVVAIWAVQVQRWIDEDDRAILLGLRLSVHDCVDLVPLGEYMMGMHEYSTAYTQVRELIEPTWSGPAPTDESPFVPVVIEYSKVETDDHASQVFQQVLLLAKLTATNKSDGNGRRMAAARFTISQCRFMHENGTISVKALRYMHKLADHGVGFAQLPAIDGDSYELCSPSVVEALQCLLAVPEASCPRRCGTRGVRILSASDDIQTDMVAPLLSAAQRSGSLKRVQYVKGSRGHEMTQDERRAKWEWVAYALFSRDASHSIRSLALDLDQVRIADVERMRQVLTADDPLAEVLDIPASSAGQSVRISASQFWLSHPEKIEVSPMPAVFESSKPIHMRAFPLEDSGSAWWIVLLPGKGKAWVRRGDAMLVEATPPAERSTVEAPQARCPIEEIACDKIFDDILEPSAAFFHLVGQHVKHICVREHYGAAKLDDWCRALLHSCPRLERLLLQFARLQTIETLADAVAGGDGAKLNHLFVDGIESATTPRHVQSFLQSLSDDRHPLVRHLQQLGVGIKIENRGDLEIIECVHRMLSQNRRLVSCSFYFSMHEELLAEVEAVAFSASFLRYDAELLAIRTAPLAIERKLALLSAVANASLVSALKGFDVHVFSIIFEFAAEHEVRHVEAKLEEAYEFI